ncbi:NPC intracellular cholesterol transporter 2-like [Pectinophora gossypiella]|uniref:MD-2-related lipid-recognition domain-containing protein n=1 Tax=Pectinophora gossypiella TaxID=13191 RepID=A0A1E1WVI3_PECGO|nr:NPC intracellular cholesterol transporter 2-like [Pectinophora gossypiella]
MLRVLAVSSLIVLGAAQGSSNVAQCVRNEGELPLSTFVRGCQGSPCLLPQNEELVIDMVFKAPRLITEMRTLATVFMGILPIIFPLEENSVTCNFLTNTYCPIVEDTIVHYILRLPISAVFPIGTSVIVEFHVVDLTTSPNQPLLCIRVPVSIVPPNNNLYPTTRGILEKGGLWASDNNTLIEQ